ncbi:uncharacterized protein LOC126374409 [Pectinophora gossypiella]|nr:uncharacterized protein LOC126374409 [Pectinophora gossypiella]
MTTATAPRKTISIHDYPEHLNPFREDDNHNKIRFWTVGRRLSRSNSINFSGIKDLKNSWAFRSFMKKGKKREPPPPLQSPQDNNKTNHADGESSPIVFRRALQYSSASTAGSRSTVGSPERYVYGGSVTPLPRSRFQERLRSSSQHEVSSLSMTPRMARSEVSGSRLSVESSNPFEDGPPVPPVRASRRKKKRAPPPPPGVADISITSENSDLQTSGENSILQTSITEEKKTEGDLEMEDMNLNIELKIVEDEDLKGKEKATEDSVAEVPSTEAVATEVTVATRQEQKDDDRKTLESVAPAENTNPVDFLEKIVNSVSFPKIDIVKYRRNSSVNEDDIKLRRGNLEDFHALTTKRSKSLTNALDAAYVTYDINLNEKDTTIDANGNEEPQKVICKLYEDTSRKQSIDTVSSTEREFLEIDKVRREFETEINKLNAALEEDFSSTGARLSVSDIKRKFDKSEIASPNPIPKPRRSHYSDSGSPVNGNVHM